MLNEGPVSESSDKASPEDVLGYIRMKDFDMYRFEKKILTIMKELRNFDSLFIVKPPYELAVVYRNYIKRSI